MRQSRVLVLVLVLVPALLTLAAALRAEEMGIPATNAYAPGQLVGFMDAGASPGSGRIARIGFHQGFLITEDQNSGWARVWDVRTISSPRQVAALNGFDAGAHNFGYAQNAIIFGPGQDAIRMDSWRGTPRAVTVYNRWEGGKFYGFPLAVHADDGYITQNSSRVIDFFDLRTGQVYGSYNPYAETGIIGKPIIIGNLLILAGHHHRGGVATYDISNLANPRLLDVLPNMAGYEPSVWGHILVLSNGSAAEGIGQPHGVIFVDFSDPSNLRVTHQIVEPDFYGNPGDNVIKGDPRYAQYQDEYLFVGNSKLDMRTYQVVQDFSTNLGQFEEYPMPFGNFVAIGGHGDGRVHIFCHQREPDTRAPLVTYRNPAPGSVNIHTGARIGFVVPETLDVTSLRDGDTVIVRPVGGSPIQTIISMSHDDCINLWPTQALADNTTYEVVLRAGGMRDVAGNALTSDISWRFSTGASINGTPGNAVPSVALTSPTAGAAYDAPATIALAATASDSDGSIARVDFLSGGSVIGSDSSAPYAFSWSGVAAGTYSLSARAVDNAGATASTTPITVTVSQPRAPFGGVAAAIPGVVQAEDYDLGGQGVAYNDLEATNLGGAYRSDGVDLEPASAGGYNVGYMEQGEWLLYTVEAAAGSYELDLRVASAATNPGSLRVLIDGVEVGIADVQGTGGWQSWTTLTLGGIDLSAGFHDLRVEVIGDGMNLDWMEFRAQTAPPPPSPVIASLTADAYPVAPGTSTRITVTMGSDPAVFEYRWTLGDGTARSDWLPGNHIDHVYASAGHYQVVVQARNSLGETATASAIVTVSPAPSASGGRSSGPIALHAASRGVAVVNPDNGSVSLLDADSLALRWERAVGTDPRGVAFDGSGRIWAACRGSDELVVLRASDGQILGRIALPYGSAPAHVLFAADGRGYASCEGSGRLARIDAAGLRVDAWLTLGPWPRALALSSDGATLWVSRFRSAPEAGAVYRVATASFSLQGSTTLARDPGPDGPSDGRGVPSFLAGFAVDPHGDALWVAGSKFNTQRGLALDGLRLTHDNTVRTMIAPIGLADGSDRVAQRRDIDNADSASAIAFSPLGDYQLVTLQGNDLLQVIDRFNGARVARLQTGSAPQGVVIDPVTERVFVKNFLSRDVSVIELRDFLRSGQPIATDLPPVRTVASESLAPQVLAGKRMFYLAEDARMSSEGYISCATCHVDGGEDGLVWDFSQRGEGLRNTITLNGRRGMGHGRVHWSANFDEIQDFEHDIRNEFSGSGFMAETDFSAGTRDTPLGDAKAGLSAELDALAAYLSSLETYPASPHRQADGSMTAAAVAGEAIFKRLDCASCHSGTDFTDSAQGLLHDVGTLTSASGSRLGGSLVGIDTPTLRGLHASAPYFHDGSAATLLDVIQRSGPQHGDMAALGSAEQAELLAYLQQLDGRNVNPGRADTTTPPPPGDGQSPFAGSAVAIGSGSTRIQAEDYDRGGEGIAWHDSDASNNGGQYRTDSVDIETCTDSGGGFNVGWIASGEWLEYTIDVASAGSYRVDLRVARQPTGSSALHLEVAGQNLSGSVSLPSTGGWQSWTTVSTQIALSAGTQVLRVAMDGGSFNLNWLELSPVGGGTTQPPAFSGVAINFQPASAPVPAGWLPDGSATFADRGNGFRYGWTSSFNETRDRNSSRAPDQVHDTLNHLQKNGVNRIWELELPNGVYQVTVLRGDPSYTDQVNHLLVEGVRMADPDGQDHFDQHTVTVEVQDGRLTIRPAADASNAKICAVEVVAGAGG